MLHVSTQWYTEQTTVLLEDDHQNGGMSGEY